MLHEVQQGKEGTACYMRYFRKTPKDSLELEILKGTRGTKVNQRTVRKKGYCREPKDK